MINEGQILADARNRVGLTQKDLAKKLGYSSAQFISNVERGLCLVPKSQLKKLEKHVGPTAVKNLISARVRNYLKELRAAVK